MYVSSREGGTRAFRSPNPKEFHEMQWNWSYGRGGVLVEEKEVPVASASVKREVDKPTSADPHTTRRRRLSQLSKKAVNPGKRRNSEAVRRSWFSNIFGLDTVLSFKEFLESRPIPLPEGCQVPNAIFARKFGLVAAGQLLPPSLPLKSMPTAESIATERAEALARASPGSSWEFKGPFTPQLGFDGGLDYRWHAPEPPSTEASGSYVEVGTDQTTLPAVRYSQSGSRDIPSNIRSTRWQRKTSPISDGKSGAANTNFQPASRLDLQNDDDAAMAVQSTEALRPMPAQRLGNGPKISNAINALGSAVPDTVPGGLRNFPCCDNLRWLVSLKHGPIADSQASATADQGNCGNPAPDESFVMEAQRMTLLRDRAVVCGVQGSQQPTEEVRKAANGDGGASCSPERSDAGQAFSHKAVADHWGHRAVLGLGERGVSYLNVI
jgi:hypothetical protein